MKLLLQLQCTYSYILNISTFWWAAYTSCSCLLSDVHKKWGTCWFVHPSQCLLTQWSSHRLHVATMVQVLLPVQSQSNCFWFLWIIWRSQSLQTDKFSVTIHRNNDITFMQAALASLIVFITASIKFWAFFTSITSACRVASHDTTCYIAPVASSYRDVIRSGSFHWWNDS